MKNAKALVFGLLLSAAGLASADECCQATNEVVAPEAAVVAVDPIQAAQAAKKAADDKAAADAAQANRVVVVADQK